MSGIYSFDRSIHFNRSTAINAIDKATVRAQLSELPLRNLTKTIVGWPECVFSYLPFRQ